MIVAELLVVVGDLRTSLCNPKNFGRSSYPGLIKLFRLNVNLREEYRNEY
jgi:hypothetical protein